LSGAVAKGDTAHYAFSGSDLTGPDANLSSDYGLVYTADDDLIQIKINVTLTDGYDKSFADLPVSFHKQLEPGHSYTLLVTFRKFTYISTGFAASNIYWNGRYLTFDAVPDGDNTRYQGVFFKFGSLVGISPVGDDDSNIKVYVPNYNSGISPSWDDNQTISSSQFGIWTGIPHEQGGSGSDRTVNWVAADAQNTPDMWDAYTGDICRYISENGFGPGGKWRLPTSAEFGPAAPGWGPSTGWEKIDGANGTGEDSWINNNEDESPDGKRITIRSGGRRMAPIQSFVPASGRRSSSGLGFVGSVGYYWSGSVNSTGGYNLNFSSSNVSTYASAARSYGYAVRCVLRE
jgi:hypothetical protein